VKNLVQTIPFLRITIAFALGIFIAGKTILPINYLVGLIGLLLAALALTQKKYTFQLELLTGWLITFLFILFGAVFTIKSNQKPFFFSNGKYSGIILETPEEKENSYKTLLRLNYYFRNDSIFKCNEKVLVYFEKNERVEKLNPGSVILFNAQPHLVENNGNPYEFDYKTYLAGKKIYRQLYLRNPNWKQTTEKVNSLAVFAESTREKLLKIYRSQNLGEEETEILSALTLGYKRGLDPETKRVFSSAGAMHVLAVSGLHVGILFAVFTLLFGFLRRNVRGKYIFVLASLSVLWGYAFITGLSASVMRAATMFSLVSVGANIQRRPNIYNSLAFAAFFLLLINPNNLHEVGFQLSFAAVFGIVFLQPHLVQLWPTKNKFLKPVWILFTVSVAAQIATFPFTSYYFNQFPTYFWISNLVVIPAAFVMIFLGIGLLLFSQVPILATILAFLTKWLIHLTFLFLKGVENLPFAVIKVGINPAQTFLTGLILIFLFIFISNQRIRTLKVVFFTLLISCGITLYNRYKQLTNSELIAYNNTDNPTIHLIQGETNYIISESPIQSDDFIYREISSVVVQKHLTTPVFLTYSEQFEDSHIFLRSGIISFNNKRIKYKDSRLLQPDNIHTSYLLSSEAHISESDILQKNQKIILFSKYPPKESIEGVHFVKSMGAYHEIL